MTKKILITGANGQLGHEMRNALKGNNRFECIFTDVAELDICNTEAVKQTMCKNKIISSCFYFFRYINDHLHRLFNIFPVNQKCLHT